MGIITLFGIIFMVMVLPFSIYFVNAGINERRQRALIRHDGITTTGIITEPATKSREPASISYSFQYEGKTYTGEQLVSFNRMGNFTLGDTVEIRYLPYRPTVALLAGKDEVDPWSIKSIIVGILMLLIALAGIGFFLIASAL